MPNPENATAPQLGPRVLVIEDDDAVACAFVRGIERAGMQAAWASTGALGLALTYSFRPHVVLVDLMLPDMSGLTLISRFVEQRDCGVVVVSGSGEEADRVVGLELGADDYITKPMRRRCGSRGVSTTGAWTSSSSTCARSGRLTRTAAR